MQTLAAKLQCVIPEENFREAYEQTKEDTTLPYWMEADFLDKTHGAMGCFPKYLTQLKQAQKAVRENEALMGYARMLEYQFRQNENLREACRGLTFPKAPEGADPLGYDTVVLFPLIAHMEKAYMDLLSRGVDKDILQTTYRSVENSISGSINRCGRFALLPMYLNWQLHYLRGEILRFERFNFELVSASERFTHVASFINDQGQLRFLMKKPFDKSGLLFGSVSCKDESNVINPQIIAFAGEQYEQEGCLSVPEEWPYTKRPMHVTVRAMNRNGEIFEVSGSELLARAFCHEIDHLDGKLMIDRKAPADKIPSEEEQEARRKARKRRR